jgi:hypothetical protein
MAAAAAAVCVLAMALLGSAGAGASAARPAKPTVPPVPPVTIPDLLPTPTVPTPTLPDPGQIIPTTPVLPALPQLPDLLPASTTPNPPGSTTPRPATPAPAPAPAARDVPAPAPAASSTPRGSRSGGPARTVPATRADQPPERDLVSSVAHAARSYAPVFALVGLVLVFLFLNGRVDRREPKLATAPVDGRGEYLEFA